MKMKNDLANGFVVKASPWTEQDFDKNGSVASDEHGNVYVLSGVSKRSPDKPAFQSTLWKSDPDLNYWKRYVVRLDKELTCHRLLRVWKEKLYVWDSVKLISIDLNTNEITLLEEFTDQFAFVHSDAFEDKLYFFEIKNHWLESYWTFSLRDASWKRNPVRPWVNIFRFGDNNVCLWRGDLYVQGDLGLRKFDSDLTVSTKFYLYSLPLDIIWRNVELLCNANGYLCHTGSSFTEVFPLGLIDNPFDVEGAFSSKNRLYVMKIQNCGEICQTMNRHRKPRSRLLFGYMSFGVSSLQDITIRKVSQYVKPGTSRHELSREIGGFASLIFLKSH